MELFRLFSSHVLKLSALNFGGQERPPSSGALLPKLLSPHYGYLYSNWSLNHFKFDAWVQISYTTVQTLQNGTEFITFASPSHLFFSLHIFASYPDLFLPTYCKCRGLLMHLMTLSDTNTHVRTPLDEGSASCRDVYLTTHTAHNR